jgi:hypothetical protein
MRQFLDNFISTNLTVQEFYGYLLLLISLIILGFLLKIVRKWFETYFTDWFEKTKYIKKFFRRASSFLSYIVITVLILIFVPLSTIESILPITNLPTFVSNNGGHFLTVYSYFAFGLWFLITVLKSMNQFDTLFGLLFFPLIAYFTVLIHFYPIAIVIKLIKLFL